jgi:ectoine hydroxylase-related dioxygenase (phytanoyl-CoA dioxygenase family)
LTGAADNLQEEGYAVLPGAVPEDLLIKAQSAFDAGYLPSPDWPTPRESDWRHSQVDLDPAIKAICRLPVLLEAAGQLIGAPFFLMQVEGREPCQGNPEQKLHRDAEGPDRQFAIAMIFLDPYGSKNGATRIVPHSHRGDASDNGFIVSGQAGDIVVMDASLLHGATTNHSGAPRRSLLVTYADATLRDELCQTEALRGVRMDTSEVFGR